MEWEKFFEPQIIERGRQYYKDGAVRDLRVSEDTINAEVIGSERYSVQIKPDTEFLFAKCSCPYSRKVGKCKHVAAVMYAYSDKNVRRKTDGEERIESKMSEKVENKLEIWKKKLLDMGLKNRLVNFRETKRSTLEIVSPDHKQLFKLLVHDEKTLKLPHVAFDSESISDVWEPSENGENEKNHHEVVIPGDLETNKTAKETHLIAKNIRDKAKTAKEEQGVNILYFSFGFVEWSETNKKNTIMSPLILVPVTLSISSITDPFTISLHEDEIVVNPTLSYKFESEFGKALPSFDAQNDDIDEYFESVRNTLLGTGFTVNTRVILSLLSFLKINMYKDLEQHAEIIGENEIIRSLAGEESPCSSILSGFEKIDHDTVDRPESVFQVVDADSSQLDAISMSKKGTSFVLQGPPGTGKSQTITNIIAEALANKKKVLFVSEKMAALEVVYKRLSAAGLADFCLVLHSNKANKREFLDSLKKVMNLPRITVKDSAMYRLRTLRDKRDKLNKYCKELHQRIMPLDQTVYEANGIIAKYQDVPDLVFGLPDIDILAITKDQLFDLKIAVSEFAKNKHKLVNEPNQNAWKDTTISVINHEKRHDMNSLMTDLIRALSAYEENIKETQGQLGIDLSIPFNKIPQSIKFLRCACTSKGFPNEWWKIDDIAEVQRYAETLKEKQKKERALADELHSKLPEMFFNGSAEEKTRELDQSLTPLIELFADQFNTPEFLLNNTEMVEQLVKAANDTVSKEQDIISACSSYLKIKRPETQKEIEKFCDVLTSYGYDFRADRFWFTSEWQNNEKRYSVLQEAASIAEQVGFIKKELVADYDKEVLDLEYRPMLFRFKTDYTSFLRTLNSSYKNDCNVIRGLKRVPVKKISYDEALALLEKLHKYHETVDQYDQKKSEYAKYLGGWFEGEETDFGKVHEAFSNFQKLLDSFAGLIPEKVVDEIASGQNVKKYDSEVYRLRSLLEDRNIHTVAAMIKDLSSEYRFEDFDSYAKKMLLLLDQLLSVEEKFESYKVEAFSMSDMYSNLKKVEELQTYEAEDLEDENRRRQTFFAFYDGLTTDYDAIQERLAWLENFRKFSEGVDISKKFQMELSSNPNCVYEVSQLADFLDKFWATNIDKIREFESWFTNGNSLESYNVSALLERITKCSNNLHGLEDWLDFVRVKKSCENNGLTSFVDSVLSQEISDDEIEPAFEKRFERIWLDAVVPSLPAVEGFRTKQQEDIISEFRELDVEQMRIAKQRVTAAIRGKLPDFDSFVSSKDEVAILTREMGKQRKIMPVRKIFDNIPNLLPVLKPCMMMSPLSVSLFLQSDSYIFDLVIFDEASQVKTENAIGAISRGKQVIIAGDVHQLPPTNFFATAVSDSDEYDEEDDSDAFESVLDEANTILPQLTLKWHYRSKNENLIAFSNNKIYNNDLVTFPSPSEDSQTEGVEFVYVPNGVYYRSTKRNNPMEANKVADIVFEQINKYPKRSVGIITFSEAQQRCVEAEILARRLQRPDYEWFFNEEKEEPFFIKNLENVQGDERDTIIFSLGYGKATPSEELHMGFGPLSQTGGYRRLNVAITRAKYAVKLVASILPTDMRISDSTPKGVKLLRDYLEFAQRGAESLANAIAYSDQNETESPFEDAVYDFLVRHGHEVTPQVGCSGYRIDMAVKHPTLNGRYVIGIECDGAAYHSSRTARERDRLRQFVLESMGWKIYRIWSTDWIKDPITEGEHLLQAVESAIGNYTDSNDSKAGQQKESEESWNYVDIVDKPRTSEKGGLSFKKYEEKHFEKQQSEWSRPSMIRELCAIVSQQSPVHIEVLYRQLAPLLGNIRATSKIRENVDDLVRISCSCYPIERKGDFLWAKDKPVIPRSNTDTDKRTLDQIALEELGEAMRIIANQSYGIEKDALFKILTTGYGFGRISAAMYNRLDEALAIAIGSGRIHDVEGKIK